MPPEVFTLAQTPITAHAFNADRTGLSGYKYLDIILTLLQSLLSVWIAMTFSYTPGTGRNGSLPTPYRRWKQPIILALQQNWDISSTINWSHRLIGLLSLIVLLLLLRTGMRTSGRNHQTQKQEKWFGSQPLCCWGSTVLPLMCAGVPWRINLPLPVVQGHFPERFDGTL